MLEDPKIVGIVETIKTYFKTYLTPILVVILLSVSYFGWRAYQRAVTSRETTLQSQNAEYKKKIDSITTDYSNLIKQDKDLQAKNIVLAADAQAWKKKAQNIIVQPIPPTPHDDNTLVADLKKDGVEFTYINPTKYSTGNGSLPIIWTWDKQAARVPALEEKLNVTTSEAASFEVSAAGYKTELDVTHKALSDADQREATRVLQQENLESQVKTIQKEVTNAQINGWLKAGAAVIIGYGAGKYIK